MPFNKQKYYITDKEYRELSLEDMQALDEIAEKVSRNPNIDISVRHDVKGFNRVVTIGKRSPVNA